VTHPWTFSVSNNPALRPYLVARETGKQVRAGYGLLCCSACHGLFSCNLNSQVACCKVTACMALTTHVCAAQLARALVARTRCRYNQHSLRCTGGVSASPASSAQHIRHPRRGACSSLAAGSTHIPHHACSGTPVAALCTQDALLRVVGGRVHGAPGSRPRDSCTQLSSCRAHAATAAPPHSHWRQPPWPWRCAALFSVHCCQLPSPRRGLRDGR
jgi:hypothetical protein